MQEDTATTLPHIYLRIHDGYYLAIFRVDNDRRREFGLFWITNKYYQRYKGE